LCAAADALNRLETAPARARPDGRAGDAMHGVAAPVLISGEKARHRMASGGAGTEHIAGAAAVAILESFRSFPERL